MSWFGVGGNPEFDQACIELNLDWMQMNQIMPYVWV